MSMVPKDTRNYNSLCAINLITYHIVFVYFCLSSDFDLDGEQLIFHGRLMHKPVNAKGLIYFFFSLTHTLIRLYQTKIIPIITPINQIKL